MSKPTLSNCRKILAIKSRNAGRIKEFCSEMHNAIQDEFNLPIFLATNDFHRVNQIYSKVNNKDLVFIKIKNAAYIIQGEK